MAKQRSSVKWLGENKEEKSQMNEKEKYKMKKKELEPWRRKTKRGLM